MDIGHETLDMHNDYVFPERASVLVSMNNMVVELVVLNCCGATQSGVYNLCVGDISNYCQGFKGGGGGGGSHKLFPPPPSTRIHIILSFSFSFRIYTNLPKGIEGKCLV